MHYDVSIVFRSGSVRCSRRKTRCGKPVTPPSIVQNWPRPSSSGTLHLYISENHRCKPVGLVVSGYCYKNVYTRRVYMRVYISYIPTAYSFFFCSSCRSYASRSFFSPQRINYIAIRIATAEASANRFLVVSPPRRLWLLYSRHRAINEERVYY